jgi:oligopeptidase B
MNRRMTAARNALSCSGKAESRIFSLTTSRLVFTFSPVSAGEKSKVEGDEGMVCRVVKVLLLVLGGLSMSGGIGVARDALPAPPVAKVVPKVDTVHGEVRVDNYYWLRERDNPEVIEYLKAENAYTEVVMKHTEPFQKKLYEEMVGRIKETDLSVPAREGDYYYYYRTERGKQYRIYCRKKGSLDAPEEVILDVNELAAGHDYCDIGALQVSPNQQLAAYTVDTTGGEVYTLYVKDLKTGELLPDVVPEMSGALVWANDNRTIFYSTLDDTKRPFRLYRHVLGSNPKDDPLIYEESDQAFYLSIDKTRSKKYLLMTLESITTTEVHFLDADDPLGKFRVIHPRQQEMEYYVGHHGDMFYIRTNDAAKNFKVMVAPVSDPSKANWRDVLPHRDTVMVDGIDLFENHLVVYEREKGLKRIRVRNFKTNEDYYVEFPEPVYTFRPTGNREYHTNILRFMYMSLVTPRSIFDYNMDDKTRELKKQDEVLGGYDPGQYRSERIFATAPDGTKIPISMVYRKGMVRNGDNPLLLYGYGAYGLSMEPYFSSQRLSLLDRGFIYAIAHIRGGEEMGRSWYEQGKLLHKKNTFTDFIACAEHLIAEKYTSPDKLVIWGGSAGGLLIGAVLNMRPDLFKAAIADVPFVDVVNTMLDPSLPLTVTEYEEWGNPHDKQYYEYIRSYSPYDNVQAQDYPNILITAGLHDARVQYWEPAKWTAKLRAMKTDNNLLLLKTKMGAGHRGASGRYDYLKDIAFKYAFILDLLGITQ